MGRLGANLYVPYKTHESWKDFFVNWPAYSPSIIRLRNIAIPHLLGFK